MASVVLLAMLSAQPAELIERTLAIVGGQAVTLSDVRTALALNLVAPGSATDPVAAATELLVERTLVLREVDRYAPPEPSDALTDARLAELRGRFSTREQFTQTLAQGGFTEMRLRAWVRDDLRIASYLDQRFAAVGTASDEDVSAFFKARRGQFEQQQLTFEQAAPGIRERLSADRRARVIADWVGDLRRRTVVVELWKGKP